MATDWEEIKRLAADFQRAQLSSTEHKLSERNCIELVNKLVKLKLIEVIYTIDGKEYLTPQQLEREIRDELIVHGGRINLVDLQQIINVDFSHVESKANEMVKSDRSLVLLNGELIDRDYLDRAADEINETLQASGQVSLAELSKSFGLSVDFLLTVIEARLGTQILGHLDPMDKGVLFTEAFVARSEARIRGVVSGITRPTPLVALVSRYCLSEKLFHGMVDRLISEGRLKGAIQGHHDKAMYIPDIYSKTQNAWIDSFFAQNGYIEYESLNRLGINDGRQYLKRKFEDREVCHLTSLCVNQNVLDQVDAAIDDALNTGSWVHVRSLLPSPFTKDDTLLLLQRCLKGPARSTAEIFCSEIVASEKFVEQCKAIFRVLMKSKAAKDVKTSPALFQDLSKKERTDLSESGGGGVAKQHKRDERHKKAQLGAGIKGGAGRGGRETKTKKSKDKSKMRGRGNDDIDDDDEYISKPKSSNEIPFLSEEEIADVLSKELPDCESDFLEDLASYLHRPLRKEYQNVAKSIFLDISTTEAKGSKRRTHNEYQDMLNGLYTNAKLFDKGLKQFDAEGQAFLSKHLLKTICTEAVNLVFEMVAAEHLMSLNEGETFTTDTRLKILIKIHENIRQPLTKLNSSLSLKDTEEFFINFEKVAEMDFCGVMLKKFDKKKERQLLFNHRQGLIDQLQRESEPAMVLHLAIVIIFIHTTNTMLHVSGRFLPQVLQFLSKHIPTSTFAKFHSYQGLVVRQVQFQNEKEQGEENDGNIDEDKKAVVVGLNEGLDEIKKLALTFKKEREE